MLVAMMSIFAIQILREDGVEDSSMDMIRYSMMIRIWMDMDQRDHEHPED